MKFSQIILERLGTIFKIYKLDIVEEKDEYLRMENRFVIITFGYNRFEKSNIIFLGRNIAKPDMVEIDNKTLNLFFNSNLRLTNTTLEDFLDNLTMFLENEAKPILLGDIKAIDGLEKFSLERSHKYTQELLLSQNLRHIDKAWSNENYNEFVKLMDKIDKDNLPTSYSLKYKIAQKKL